MYEKSYILKGSVGSVGELKTDGTDFRIAPAVHVVGPGAVDGSLGTDPKAIR